MSGPTYWEWALHSYFQKYYPDKKEQVEKDPCCLTMRTSALQAGPRKKVRGKSSTAHKLPKDMSTTASCTPERFPHHPLQCHPDPPGTFSLQKTLVQHFLMHCRKLENFQQHTPRLKVRLCRRALGEGVFHNASHLRSFDPKQWNPWYKPFCTGLSRELTAHKSHVKTKIYNENDGFIK